MSYTTMAAVPTKTDTKLSFAKVAAIGGKENVALAASKTAVLNTAQMTGTQLPRAPDTHQNDRTRTRTMTSTTETGVRLGDGRIVAPEPQKTSQDAIAEATAGKTRFDSKLVDGIANMSIDTTPSLVVNGSGSDRLSKTFESETSLDDFARTDSGSELGTKPPSLDGKSITSGTTFALDEKESLRPDDSASVKAADDDDAFSGRGSIVAGSRIGSEAAARAYRAQSYEVAMGRMPPAAETTGQGILTPQSGSSVQHLGSIVQKPLMGSADDPAFTLFYKQTPDEKLLEALDSPKDRIFLLRLEQDVIEFVKDSKEPFIDLPPCNSFCRMLTHKLADYYHMTHQVDATAGSVRIFRTPFCRLPQSLTSISNPPTTGHTPPPPLVPTMKIMRRGGDPGDSPSKTTSDAGSDGKDKALSAKEKLSREEREAKYNAARERIFGPSTGDATPETEDGNDMSRSSSVSVKDRATQNKKNRPIKQRRDDSDGFDVRSQYTPFFPNQQQPTWAATPQFAPIVQPQFPQYNVPMQPSYQPTSINTFNSPALQSYPPAMGPPQMPHHNNHISQHFSPAGPQHFQNRSAPITTYGSPAQTPPQQMPQWPQQQNYQVSYNQGPQRQPALPVQPSVQPTQPMKSANTIPYAYGQLPNTVNSADPKSQHPIPGSFNRHAFNPQTQSFVPGNGPMPTQQQASQHQHQHASPPNMHYNNFVPHQYNPPQHYGSGSASYNMARQNSNGSLPSPYHASPHMAPRLLMHQTMAPGYPGMPSLPQMPQGMPQNMNNGNNSLGSHLPHFGNASSLPPKPPPAV